MCIGDSCAILSGTAQCLLDDLLRRRVKSRCCLKSGSQ
jgi:hypothetical protein